MKIFRLNVQRIICGGWVKSIRAAPTQLPGVNTINVTLQTGHVTVNYYLPEGGDPLVLASKTADYLAEVSAATTAPLLSAKKYGGCCV